MDAIWGTWQRSSVSGVQNEGDILIDGRVLGDVVKTVIALC